MGLCQRFGHRATFRLKLCWMEGLGCGLGFVCVCVCVYKKYVGSQSPSSRRSKKAPCTCFNILENHSSPSSQKRVKGLGLSSKLPKPSSVEKRSTVCHARASLLTDRELVKAVEPQVEAPYNLQTRAPKPEILNRKPQAWAHSTPRASLTAAPLSTSWTKN